MDTGGSALLASYFISVSLIYYLFLQLKGLVWLFFATIAFVPPVVSGDNSMYTSLQLILTSPSQVLLSLESNGKLFIPVKFVDYSMKS